MLQLPRSEKSFWREAYPAKTLYPSLTDHIETDVVVVGGGITGLTAAYLLKQSGKRVVVVEKHTIGGGTTGRSTGKVTSQHGIFYTPLGQVLGRQAAQTYADANQTAVNKIEAIIRAEKIECDWQRDNNYVFTSDRAQINVFKREAELAASLGLPAKFVTTTPLPFDVQGAVVFADQGKMNAVKYALGLAKAVNGNGSHVFERSTAIGIKDGHPGRVRTAKGMVYAKHIVVVSSVPTLPLVARASYGLQEGPSETYAVAGRLDNELPDMYISPDRDHYSILPLDVPGGRIVLIVGETHIWGLRGNRQARFERLADYANRHFGVDTIINRWSDRDYAPYDSIPLVGKLYPWSKNVYVGTGFRKWGLSNGTAAGMMLRDLIMGRPNPWTGLYNPYRRSRVTSLPRRIALSLLGTKTED